MTTARVLDTDFDVVDAGPGGMGIKILCVRTSNEVDATDTIPVTLTDFGIHASGLIGVIGFKHTTDNSVMEQEQPTTAVAGGVLTITVPSGTDDDPRFYLIYGFAKDSIYS